MKRASKGKKVKRTAARTRAARSPHVRRHVAAAREAVVDDVVTRPASGQPIGPTVAQLQARVRELATELCAMRNGFAYGALQMHPRTPLPILLPGTWTPAAGPAKGVDELDDAHVANILRLAARRSPSTRALELLAVAYEAGKRGLVKGPPPTVAPPKIDRGFTPGLDDCGDWRRPDDHDADTSGMLDDGPGWWGID